ncbi:MAG TPA: response regulator [Novosphingobium sp.]|nr:response regulator [Novosphingobium sp.]
MSVSDQIAIHLPYLRRYARALTGSQHSGDAYVRATLEAALADAGLREEIARSRAALYGAFTRIWSAGHVEDAEQPDEMGGQREQAVQMHLAAIPPTHRQALLLTTMEEFSREETARILGIEVGDVDRLVNQAIAEIENESATNVLIIEDEPLISMQLEGLVTELGHTVVGTAATHAQTLEIFEKSAVGLVLADIQLADGSSGIEAVEDLLKFGEVPVIFITAYPERLLTGERPEPTYLVTKPFQEATVRAAISQALFFSSPQTVVR